MKKNAIKTVLMIIAVSAALVFSVFAVREGGYLSFFNIDDVTFEEENPDEPSYTPVPVIPGPVSNRLFGLAYMINESFNPITGENSVNRMAGGLVYDGLFTLGSDWEPVETLCEEYEMIDELHYLFRIKQGIIMHDGEELTAADCEYSLNLARTNGSYKTRLSMITSVRVTGDYELTIGLARPVARIAALLDVPIIRKGDVSVFPAGTGPYKPAERADGEYILSVFTDWWKKDRVPISNIELLSARDIDELMTYFDSGAADVIQTDPTGTEIIGLRGGYEVWPYETLTLQFIGFNTARAPFDNINVRRAVSRAFDREYLSQAVFTGHAKPALLSVPETSGFYSERAAGQAVYSLVAMCEILYEEGFEDGDNDGILDYMVGNRREPMTPDLIVNVENTYKVKAAEALAATLIEVGIEINIRALKWNDFITALESGDYDMYYGETRISADFSPRFFVSAGGRGNPSSYQNEELEALIYAFETAPTVRSAEDMFLKIIDEAPFVPLLFKGECVYTPRGVVRGIDPIQSNVFNAIEKWTINK